MNLNLISPDVVSGKKTLVRVDFNVPIEDGKVKDDTRIRESLPTILNLLEQKCRIAIISHLGRPKGKPDPAFSLAPVARELELSLRKLYPALENVRFVGDCIGESVESAVKEQRENEVLLLENTRFYAGEEENDEDFAKKLASPFDIFISDAFGSLHRAHASTVGVTKFLPSYAGLLVEKEVQALSRLTDKIERPYTVLIGGKKIADKLPVLENLIGRADVVLVGGATANTFSKAMGNSMGKSVFDAEMLSTAKELIDEYRRSTTTLVLPADFTVTDDFKQVRLLANRKPSEIRASEIAGDIGDVTRTLYAQYIRTSSTIFWNGPLGAFETSPFEKGSQEVANALASNPKAFSVAGGGETLEMLNKLGLSSIFTHVSTGGGASLEFIAGKTLPGLVPLLAS